MFKKPFTTKQQSVRIVNGKLLRVESNSSFQVLRSSDRKKLRSEILAAFPLLTEDTLNAHLIPSKEEVTSVKLLTHGQLPGVMYVVGNLPLFFRIGVDGALTPTVYALWRVPDMVARLSTHGVVMKRVFDGADLMLPGVIFGPSGVAPDAWKAGDAIGMMVRGGPFPLAVGNAVVGAEVVAGMTELKGRGVKTVHAYGDFLWASGDKSEPPEVVGDSEAGDLDEEDYEVVFEDEGFQVDGVESLDDSVTGAMDALSVTSPTSEEAFTEVRVDAEMAAAASKTAPSYTPAEMDKILESALLTAIKTKLTDDAKSYPITSSILLEKFLEPCREFGTTVDLKQSSFKKLAKFLKSMDKKGYIKLKERNGDMLLMSVNRKHPEVAAFVPPKRLAADVKPGTGLAGVASTSASKGSAATPPPRKKELSIVELYRASGSVANIWNEIGISDTYMSKADVKFNLDEYIKSKSLVGADPRLVKLDPYLANTLLKKDENDVDYLTREALFNRILEKMSPFHELTLPDHDPVIKKGVPKPIQVIVELRQGRKHVTRVLGVEAYGIDPDELSSELKVRCASSTTITPLPGKSSTLLHDVTVQGSKIPDVCLLLCEKYGVPFTGKGGKAATQAPNYGLKGGPQSKYVEVTDKTEKK
ncbi:Eukaryotic translation initiation factor 2D [Irineochytrium annulatum]|nr:Eukaryotic translation initiation factor 2D [Irineochytrium annulatum]